MRTLTPNYLALGDSISIDDYTEVRGGGAVSQFGRLIDARLVQDLTRDGNTTGAVIDSLDRVNIAPQLATVTAGGNDFLQFTFSLAGLSPGERSARAMSEVGAIESRLETIAVYLKRFDCPVIWNTVYDPSDGNDALAAEMGIPRELRAAFDTINDAHKSIAQRHGFVLCDLEKLFHRHGVQAQDTWITMQIEPNYAGATAIAQEWRRLYAAI
ncbi:hypothetical protein CCAX7_009880 [Capsulimonas corticalis]|uniref:Uncharacterized protein n=1 Tax=Capsulimonas corticalis TaxID=2219043 RepID=A0A402CUE5_9BACT|nr:SGNH/GDSL hydrolase family protein [Capsulimonas corticalis]BDI28937.1 hypothetical protein CCAX7_009880 [Capsulimonas corticalis]